MAEIRKVEILFDSRLKCRSGKIIPYYDTCWYDDPNNEFVDQSEHWFHEGYGYFKRYKIHQVDNTNTFIAEPLEQFKHKSEIDFSK